MTCYGFLCGFENIFWEKKGSRCSKNATSEPSGHYTYRQFNIQQLYVLPTQCICVLCGSQNKQRLFPYTALTGFYNPEGVCLLRGTNLV